MKKVIQFGYNVRVPEGIPLVDCRVIKNPYPKFAHDRVAARHAVRSDPNFAGLVVQAEELLRKHDVIGIGCGYGVHRSGAVVEELEGLTGSILLVPDFEVEKIGKA